MEKEQKVDRRRGVKTILKSGQEWTMSAQVGQLKTRQDEMERDCCEVINGAQTTLRDFG